MSEHDSLLRETVAHHFPDAKVDGDDIDLAFGGLHIACRVNELREIGAYTTASLFFSLRGGRLGSSRVFASMSGYGESAAEAVVAGACHWSDVFGPVLRAGLAGEDQPEVDHFDATVDGLACRVFVDGIDRGMSTDGSDVTERLPVARARFARNTWLVRAVLASGRLPMFAADRPTVLSVFVMDSSASRVVEVKVNGYDWPGMTAVFDDVAPEPQGAAMFLRELAVIVPTGDAAPLAWEPIVRTVAGLGDREQMSWPGWAHHKGELAPPLAPHALDELEARLGSFPADYRDFVATVSASGAGPGYGLISPGADVQRFSGGAFAWTSESDPEGAPRGTLVLAHGGCGVVWLLVLTGAHRGAVWVDARSSDGKVRRVAESFSFWYRDWLNALVSGAVPWLHWDHRCCSTPSVVSQLVEFRERDGLPTRDLSTSLKPGALAIASVDSPYLGHRAILNPCQGCTSLVARFGGSATVFARGEELSLDAAVPRGWWTKLGSRLLRRRP